METVNTAIQPEKTRRRVLLKLSGEVIGGGKLGVDPETVRAIAKQIAAAVTEVEVAIVVGGGNFFRGAELSQSGMDRSRADYMGMLGTVMNCLALQDFLEQAGVETRVQSAITMGQVAEAIFPAAPSATWKRAAWSFSAQAPACPTSPPTPLRHSGPLKCTQTWSSWPRAVWTASTPPIPRRTPTAEKLDVLSYDDALRRDIRVMDQTAMTMCKDNSLSMVVFGMEGEGNVTRAILGETLGTLVTP